MGYQLETDLYFLSELSNGISRIDNYSLMLETVLKKGAKKVNVEDDTTQLSKRRHFLTIAMERRENLSKSQEMVISQLQFNQFFCKLPFELILHVLRHTHIKKLWRVINSGEVADEVFRTSRIAVFRGMEVEQFSELKWLFGDSIHRTPAQQQDLNDCIASVVPGSQTVKYIFHVIRLFEDGAAADPHYIQLLQKIADHVSTVAELHSITRRAALCLMMISSQRTRFCCRSKGRETSTGEANQTGHQVHIKGIPMRDRLNLVRMQSKVIKIELRRTIERGILKFTHRGATYTTMGELTVKWLRCYYSSERVDHKMTPQEMGTWITELAASSVLGIILQDLSRNAHVDCRWRPGFFDALHDESAKSGSSAKLWKEEKEFAAYIGCDWSILLKDSPVGTCLEELQHKTL